MAAWTSRDWQRVYAIARRRKMFFDGQGTLACYISSVSDIDDLIPILTAYQIEWNKLHRRFHKTDTARALLSGPERNDLTDAELGAVAARTRAGRRVVPDAAAGLAETTWTRRCAIWPTEPLDLRLNLLAGSAADYRQAVQAWWFSVQQRAGLGLLVDRSIYFISSNPHSLPNLLSGHIKLYREAMIDFLRREQSGGLVGGMGTAGARGQPGRRGQSALLR